MSQILLLELGGIALLRSFKEKTPGDTGIIDDGLWTWSNDWGHSAIQSPS